MDHADLFILNAHPSPDLGNTLEEILTTIANVRVKHAACSGGLLQEPPPHTTSHIDDQLQKTDVAFLVVPALPPSEIQRTLSALRTDRNLPIVLVSDATAADDIIDYLRSGIADHLTPPLRSLDVLPRLWRLVEHAVRKKTLTERLKEGVGLRQIIGTSPALMAEIRKIPVVAACDSSVLISGETGTGKEMFARTIHYLGPRAGRPFIPVNCGAIPSELVENELFGHVRGAFTGANVTHEGLVSEAQGGTLFLDEIDCLPPQAQVKLLRLLQEKVYRKLGSTKMQRSDIRVIAAASSYLAQTAEQGGFRQDLFYRLSIVQIAIPPLRERCEDIPLLAQHFLAESASEQERTVDGFSPEALQKLKAHRWPGNVRELENTIKRAVIFAKTGVIQQEEIDLPRKEAPASPGSFQEEKAKVIEQFEITYIRELLAAHHGNITQAARTAGKNRRAFWELIRKYDINVETYRPHDR